MSDALRIARGRFGRVALLDMDRPLVRHAHPHCHVLLKVEGADTQFQVKDGIARLTDESAVLINAWEPHAYEHDLERPKTVILALYIEPHWLAHFRPNWAASNAPDFFDRSVGAITPEIRRLTELLASTMIYAPQDAHVHEELLGRLMIAVIERFTAWRGLPNSIRSLADGRMMDYRIQKAVRRIQDAPGEVDDMNALARDVGLSRAHFFRLFENNTGVSPRVFLNVQRLECAVQQVVESEDTFAAIGEKLGFSVPAHFSRFFHDHAGSSPSIFRRVTRLNERI
ncbi:AraC family transcriptional regulator [Nitratireductor indicus C115]|uniref:AraC family transcriptional regulator n=1 Tax=Nitratireductor indicus C115 TaxID=1231190 RepID=K2NTP9_9HYPH|nr:AraC family transcriptional regulator [Nitratireductor indicus]EKF42660.1 AraC family transcriptional regulator [Nitratireductor indicus C115]SFQ38434.1 AraC-type DNA-binding protein [Nitratireductor indicus]